MTSAASEINTEIPRLDQASAQTDSIDKGDNLAAYRMGGDTFRVASNPAQGPLPDWFPPSLSDSRRRITVFSDAPGKDQSISNLEPGVLHRDQIVNVDGQNRKFSVYLPKSYDGKNAVPLVVALDGIQLNTNNAVKGMAYSNKMIEQSEKYGFALLIPEHLPQPLLSGVLTGYGWNEPNGAVNFTKPQLWSDSRYIAKTVDKMQASLNIDKQKVFGVGFSHGGLELHELVSKNPGMFNAIASVHGTMLDSIGTTPAGTRFLAIHGEGDKALPYKGGLGWGNWAMATRNYGNNDSKPYAQIGRYLNANGITDPAEHTETQDFKIRTYRKPGQELPVAQEIFLKDPRWGHSWHGRGGEPTMNGTPAPASVLDANERIFNQFFGLRPR